MVSVVANEQEYKNICHFLMGKDHEVKLTKDVKYRIKKKSTHFILLKNELYLKNEEGLHKKVFHNEDIDRMILETKKIHKIKHYGVNRFEDVCNELFFKIPRNIIRDVVSSCTTCAQAQPLKTKEKFVHILAKRPMERLMIDLIDMQRYKESNKQYGWILTVIDVYSKFAWAFPLFKKSGVEVSETLEALFFRNTGPPIIIQSDNGKEFINKEMHALCERFKIIFKHSRPRHPQSNGQIERFNQTLTRYLQKYIFEEEQNENEKRQNEQKIWIKYLDKVLYHYNLAKHSSTKKTPFRMRLQIPGFNTILGGYVVDVKMIENGIFEEILSIENNQDEKFCLSDEKKWDTSVSEKYLDRMDRNSLVHTSKYDISIGEEILISKDFDNNTKTKKLKLSSFFTTPAKVTEILSNNRIKIKNIVGQYETVHLSKIKKLNKKK